MSARILVAGRSEICRELFNDPDYTLPDSIKATSDSIIKKTGYK